MKKILLSSLILGGLTLAACHKDSSSGSGESFTAIETDVITDFVNKTALPQYSSLVQNGNALTTAISSLNTSATDANLQTCQTAWKAMRLTWERCEGFLIGPVESYDYDPNSDTWPTDYNQMDSLLTKSANSLSTSDVANLPATLRGYHPIEYLIFGHGGTRKASELDPRTMKYLVGLISDLNVNNVQPLQASWTQAPVNFSNQVLTAGKGSTQYTSKQAFFLDVVGDNGMAGICNEVGQQNEDGKMYNPYISRDSSLAESPYSGNSLIDFKNNIVGLQQVYMGLSGGKGIKDLVAAKNKSLDQNIQNAITAAVNSFDNISGSNNERFELAIYDRRTQIAATITALNSLQDLLENDLTNFVKQYVKD